MRRWRMLVVDDEPLNLEIIREYLDDPRYDLDLVLSAESALERLEAPGSRYDLIILDRMMPGMNGIELLKRLKAERRFRTVPVIMQTAASSPEQVREGIEAGAYYYLTKPYEPAALAAIVRAALEDIEFHAIVDAKVAEQTNTWQLVQRAEFRFASLEDAKHLSGLLAMLCPSPEAVAIGLSELMVNAVEHGSVGITYAEKRRLKREDAWEEEVSRRLQLPENRDRYATVAVERRPGEIVFTVTDQGSGFDWKKYMEFDPERMCDPNGRGIAMARAMSFVHLDYRPPGNVVMATVALGGSQ